MAAVIGRAELLRRGVPAPTETVARMVLYGLIGLIVGGRLGAVLIYYPSYFFAHPWDILALWRGGMSFHGGLIGVTVAGLILARSGSLSFPEMADITALAFPVGNMLVKIGNFINGEIVGTVTTVPWGVVFPKAGNCHVIRLNSTRLFWKDSSFLQSCGFLVPKARRPGEVFSLFLVLYGIFRFAVEFFREPDTSILGDLQWLTIGQIFSILMIMAGMGFLIFLHRASVARKSRTRYPQKATPP